MRVYVASIKLPYRYPQSKIKSTCILVFFPYIEDFTVKLRS